MPEKALTTFNLDIARAEELMKLAAPMPTSTEAQKLLRSDVLRSSWMFAVGAMDAYFCDAYTDLIASTFICKSREPSIALTAPIEKIQVPVAVILAPRQTRDNWRWRMAARRMMEDQNALKIETIQRWFKPFLGSGQRFFLDLMPIWSQRSNATARLFGMTSTQYLAMHGTNSAGAADRARNAFERRFEQIVQRRHDCIHNCDRPDNVPQPLDSWGTVRNVIVDIKFIVQSADAHLDAQFSIWLRNTAGFSSLTASTVGY